MLEDREGGEELHPSPTEHLRQRAPSGPAVSTRRAPPATDMSKREGARSSGPRILEYTHQAATAWLSQTSYMCVME